MSSAEENLNSLNCDVKFWQDFSSYKKALYLTQNAPDCCFVINLDSNDTKTFYAHKAILKSASPKFQTMFNDNTNEACISNTDPQVFKKFIDFIYYGDADNLSCADANTLRHLISLGKKYEVGELIKNCIDTMKLNLANAENYDLINIFEYACLTEDNELIKECKRVIVGRAKPIPKFQDFNINQQQDEKRHIALAKKQLNGFQKNASKSTVNDAANVGQCGDLFAASSSNNANNGNQLTMPNKPLNIFASAPNNNKILTLFGTSAKNPVLSDSSSNKPVSNGAIQKSSPDIGNNKSLFGHIAQAVDENQTLQHTFAYSSSPKSQPTEEKLQNTDSDKNENFSSNIFNPMLTVGLNKGKITDCACIYGLNPSVFYEFQITLSGYISELLRFNMIETYAKINHLTCDDFNTTFQEFVQNKDSESNTVNTEENPANVTSPEVEKQSKIVLSKQILNMMLRSIKFYRMTAKEFCSGPGKSSLLDMEEKYDLLVTIVNKN